MISPGVSVRAGLRPAWLARLFAVCLLAALAPVASAWAAFPGENGLIAYESSDAALGGSFYAPDIHAVGVDGLGNTPLTSGTPDDREPRYSPDGTKVVFASNRGRTTPGFDIHVMNADGSGLERLTNGEGSNLDPSFSPDGTEIIFTSSRDDPDVGHADYEVYVMNADGTGVRRLTANVVNDGAAFFAPDGRTIAFGSTRAHPDCPANQFECSRSYVMDADGGNQRRLTGSVPFGSQGARSWSPDGERIAFFGYIPNSATGWDVWVADADGTDVKQLTTKPGGFDWQPTFSPDGTKIVFSGNGWGNARTPGFDLYMVNADGSPNPDGSIETRITNTPAVDERAPDWGPKSGTTPPPPPRLECEDGADNEGDGRVDFPADPDCRSPADDTEQADPAPPQPPSRGEDPAPDPASSPPAPIETLGSLGAATNPRPSAPAPTCRGLRATIVGTARGERITGTRSNDVILAGPGHDRINSRGGNDLICAGMGNDRVAGGPGADRIYGGSGRDRLSGGAGRDRLFGGTGRDRLLGGPGRDRMSGGPGRDRERQ